MSGFRIVNDPESVMVAQAIVTDRRVSAVDLGVYVRFAFAAQMLIDPDLDTLVRELKMPREETEAALTRLVALEYLDDLSRRAVVPTQQEA